MKSKSQAYVPVHEGPLQGSIIALTILTSIVHFYLAFSRGVPTKLLPIMFLLNGIGYLVLLVALYLPALAIFQRPIRWLFIAYTLLTFILWVVITHAAFDPFDYTDKLIELCLIVLLFAEAAMARNGVARHAVVSEN